jgi:hypothetical protein
MLKNLYVEYWLIQVNDEVRLGPFSSEDQAQRVVVEDQLNGFELRKVLSYIPF